MHRTLLVAASYIGRCINNRSHCGSGGGVKRVEGLDCHLIPGQQFRITALADSVLSASYCASCILFLTWASLELNQRRGCRIRFHLKKFLVNVQKL